MTAALVMESHVLFKISAKENHIMLSVLLGFYAS